MDQCVNCHCQLSVGRNFSLFMLQCRIISLGSLGGRESGEGRGYGGFGWWGRGIGRLISKRTNANTEVLQSLLLAVAFPSDVDNDDDRICAWRVSVKRGQLKPIDKCLQQPALWIVSELQFG